MKEELGIGFLPLPHYFVQLLVLHILVLVSGLCSRESIDICMGVGRFTLGLVWISLMISLNIRPPKWLKAVILITAFDVETLVRRYDLEVIDMISWPSNLLLLLYAMQFDRWTKCHWSPFDDGISHPLLVEENSTRRKSSEAGFFSCLTFSWLNPLLRLGASKPLVLDDIPPLDSEDDALNAYETFSEVWKNDRKHAGSSSNLVAFSLAKCYGKEMLLIGLYAFLKTISVSSNALLLYAFIKYSTLEVKELHTDILLVGCLFLAKVVESLSQRHWYFDSRRHGMRMRSSVLAAVYQKQLKLSSIGRKKHSTGEVVNYIVVDTYRLGEFPRWFHMGWSSVLQLVFAVLILFAIVGWGAVPGLVPLIICGFLNVPIARTLQRHQSQFMVAQDARLRATSEAFTNMKIIKLQSWEDKFRHALQSLRDAEFKWLKDSQITKTYGTGLYWVSPLVVSAVIFAGTVVIQSAPLDAGIIFTVLLTLRIMSEPMRMLPEALSILIQVKVSLDRIGAFLLEERRRCGEKSPTE